VTEAIPSLLLYSVAVVGGGLSDIGNSAMQKKGGFEGVSGLRGN
jgi:hypothetical protein